jgi:hypothetical protein
VDETTRQDMITERGSAKQVTGRVETKEEAAVIWELNTTRKVEKQPKWSSDRCVRDTYEIDGRTKEEHRDHSRKGRPVEHAVWAFGLFWA